MHMGVHPLNLWALRRSQFRTSDLGLHLDIPALRRPQSHIPGIAATIYKCDPPTQAYSLDILTQSDRYTS